MQSQLQIIGKSYLDIQQLRVSCELRIQKFKESYLENVPETEQDAKLEELANEKSFQMLKVHKDRLHKQEKELLKDAHILFEKSELWDWCNVVNGLGDVAAMTFLSTIDAEKCTSAGKMWALLGYVPGAKRIKGEKARFNPHLKGRYWMITNNVIMANDEYYAKLYRLKKEYYSNRPDILAKKESVKGWKGWIDAMAKRWLIKLIVSHAIEIIRHSEGLPFNPHHDYIPPKPKDPMLQAEVIEMFTKAQTAHLEELRGQALKASVSSNGDESQVIK